MKSNRIIPIIIAMLALPHTGCLNSLDYKTTKEPVEVVSQWSSGKQKRAQVLEVIKKSGESVVFPEDSPGKIQDATVVGNRTELHGITIEKSNVKTSTLRPNDNTLAVETITGEFYVLKTFEIGEKAITGQTDLNYNPIPFSDIASLWVKRAHNVGKRAITELAQLYGAAWCAMWALVLLSS